MDNNGIQFRDLHDSHTNRNVSHNCTTGQSIFLRHAKNASTTHSINVITIAPQWNYRG